jgi:putative molybdopterin biosynthesis protein
MVKLLKVTEVADRLSISLSMAYQLIETGAITHYRIGGAIRISEEQLSEYLKETERRPERPRSRTGPRPRLKHLSI